MNTGERVGRVILGVIIHILLDLALPDLLPVNPGFDDCHLQVVARVQFLHLQFFLPLQTDRVCH